MRDRSVSGRGEVARDREAAILERLEASAGGFVSGAEMAAALEITRAAVGKRVDALRARGWEIEAVSSRGYRLLAAADTLDPLLVGPLLATRWLGRGDRYHHRSEVGSSNAEVAAMAAAGAPAGTVVAADSQTDGRGRLGRPWHSPPGENIYLSLLLRPALAPTAAPPLSLAAAVGAAEAVAAVCAGVCRPVVKWPNDLLLGGRKVAGILLELNAELERLRHVVVGVGLNVNTTCFPAPLRRTATSLAQQLGGRLRRAALVAALLNHLEPWFEVLVHRGPAQVIKAWMGYADWLGERILVHTTQGAVSGVAVGLDPTGALQLRDDRGISRSIMAGDVTLGPAACGRRRRSS